MAMNQPTRNLPPFAQWVLTRRIPCAVMVTLMYATVLAFAGSVLSLPLLVLHLMTPTLFAVIALGGGFSFAMQVALLAAVAVTALSGGDLEPGMLLLLLYGLLPVLAAGTLMRPGGVSKSGLNLAMGLLAAMLAVLLSGAAHAGSVTGFVHQMLSPLFEASKQEGMDPVVLHNIESMTVQIFPGMTVVCLWLVWWGDVILGRNIATYYGFYRGDAQSASEFRLPRGIGIGFMLLAGLVSFTGGTVQYLAINIALVFAGLLAAQGLAVVHSWLSAKKLQIAAIVMYVMLLIQPVMVLPFAVIGLLDIWYDYRRNIMPADGGK